LFPVREQYGAGTRRPGHTEKSIENENQCQQGLPASFFLPGVCGAKCLALPSGRFQAHPAVPLATSPAAPPASRPAFEWRERVGSPGSPASWWRPARRPPGFSAKGFPPHPGGVRVHESGPTPAALPAHPWPGAHGGPVPLLPSGLRREGWAPGAGAAPACLRRGLCPQPLAAGPHRAFGLGPRPQPLASGPGAAPRQHVFLRGARASPFRPWAAPLPGAGRRPGSHHPRPRRDRKPAILHCSARAPWGGHGQSPGRAA